MARGAFGKCKVYIAIWNYLMALFPYTLDPYMYCSKYHPFNSCPGIQTAMRHDTIMEGGYADYALVEGEARRVAKEAVQALKESRRQCWQAGMGVPTWTGQSGALRSPSVSGAQVR